MNEKCFQRAALLPYLIFRSIKNIELEKVLRCFLDIGAGSNFQFMSLDFGSENGWSDSNFVLIDGELAPFQPEMDFNSIPSVNFHWLTDQTITFDRRKTSSRGIIVFNSASNVDLFYHDPAIKGLV